MARRSVVLLLTLSAFWGASYLFIKVGLDELPDPAAFDPSPEEEGELRERLLKAGEQRAQSTPGL